MGQRGLSGPAFTDDRERLAAVECEADAAESVDTVCKPNVEIIDLQDRSAHDRAQRGFERGSMATPRNARPMAAPAVASPAGKTHHVHAAVA